MVRIILTRVAVPLILLTLAQAVHADVVRMTDGRRFEGTVIHESDSTVTIDAMVAGVRAKLTLPRKDVAAVARAALPAHFYDGPAPAERVSEPGAFDPSTTLYLEVPIVGRFGDTIFAQGVHEALHYAVRHGIGHVVFVVDTEPGDLDEAVAVYRLLGVFDQRLTFHAIVRNCVGDGLAVPLRCASVHFAPGCRVGGVQRTLEGKDPMLRGESDQVIRARLAEQATAHLKPRVRPLIRAMIDPNVSVAAWRDDEGQPVIGSAAPQGLPADRLVCSSPAGQLLVLGFDQFKALGAPTLDGDADALGAALGIEAWKAESDFGRKTMDRATAAVARRTDAAQHRFEYDVRNSIQRRDETDAHLRDQLAKAAEADPLGYQYTAYPTQWHDRIGGRRGGGDRWRDYDDGVDELRTLTQKSQELWRQRTDLTTRHLEEAAKSAKVIKRLDETAVRLGLKPTYAEGELDKIMKEIDDRYRYLKANRNRVTTELPNP